MKSGIHPTWHDDAKVTCSCGNSFTTGSVEPTLEVDICNKCHPFFTGELKFVDRQGRVERFMAKMKKAKDNPQSKKKAKKQESSQADPKSYQELLREQQTNLKKAAKGKQPEKTDKTAAKKSAADDKSADK